MGTRNLLNLRAKRGPSVHLNSPAPVTLTIIMKKEKPFWSENESVILRGKNTAKINPTEREAKAILKLKKQDKLTKADIKKFKAVAKEYHLKKKELQEHYAQKLLDIVWKG
jgi:hypothetical protein